MIFYRCDKCGAEFPVSDFLPSDEKHGIPPALSYLFRAEKFFTDGKTPCHLCRNPEIREKE